MRSGRFREDLFFRLNVFCMLLPPLRERVEDIPLLVEYFTGTGFKGGSGERVQIEPDAMRSLMGYRWPGNIRELQNAIERATILCENRRIKAENLPPSVRSSEAGAVVVVGDENLSIKQAEDAIERDLIRKALIKTGGNRTQAAKILEISHRSLLYKLKEYGIE